MYTSQLCKPEGMLLVFSPHGLLQQSNEPSERDLLKTCISTLATAVLIYVSRDIKRDWYSFLERQIEIQWDGYNGTFYIQHNPQNVVHFTVGTDNAAKHNYHRYREIVLSLNDYYRYDIQSVLMNMKIPNDVYLHFKYVDHDKTKLLLTLTGG